MGVRIRAADWAATPLGPPEGWPQALKTTLRTLLTTRHPAFIFWGPELLCFYNDAYRPSIGPEKHPRILGLPGRQAWPEIWDIIGPDIAQVMTGGEATWHENALVPIERHGAIQDVYWTYSYGPIHDDGAPHGVGGVLVLCTETTEQVLSGQRRAAEAAGLKTLFEGAPSFICVLRGPEHRFELVNAAYRDLVGGRDFTGQTIREALPELDGQGYVELLDQVYRDGVPHVGRASRVVIERGGVREERFVDFVYQPLRDDAGRVNGIFCEGSDVTDSVRARQALAESEAKYRALFDQLDAGFCIVEVRPAAEGRPLDYRVVEANPAFYNQTGLEHVVGRWIREAVPGLEEHWFETYGRVAETGTAMRFENGADALGSRWFDVHAFRIGAPEERRVAILFNDISARRRTEQALRRSETRWRGLFESMQEGLALCEMIFDADGRPADFRYIEVNAAWERLIGIPATRAIGNRVKEIVPEVEPFWIETCGRVVTTGEPAHVEHPVAALGRWYEAMIYRTEPGQFALLFLDVTERRAAQERQELLSREVDHRAKNALAVVQAAVRLTKAPDLASYVRAIEGRVSALARAQTLLAEDRWTGADLHALLRGELSVFMGGDGAVATLDGPAVALPAGAAQPLAMAVHELATNAVKHGALSRRSGRVAVGWAVADGALRMRWKETGGPPVPGAPDRRGFGSRVLDATVRGQLGGEVAVTWQADGLMCELVVPLVRRGVEAAAAG